MARSLAGDLNTLTTPIALTSDNLPLITRASVPTYDRSALKPGIVHFGVGNFHRAHLGCYLHDLFNQGRDQDWAIIGAGLRPSDAAMRDALAGQDWLTTIVEQDAGANKAHVTGPMIDFLPVGDPGAIIETLADPAIRIVSLTITEGGYFVDSASGVFDASDPDIVHDGAHPLTPRTVFGCILAGLERRRASGCRPFTVMSCDNVPGNGDVTRNAVAGLADLRDGSLAAWVRQTVAFPNAMVDRITPATGDRERAITADLFGVADASPVLCEDFTQWVLEDHFPAGRPAFESVGAELVPDVEPYEMMKIRILNGGHAVIGYAAAMLDIHFVHDAMDEPLISAFLDLVEREEIIPHVPPVPNTDLAAYFEQIKRRFANPKIGDKTHRLCLDGSNRQPKFIVPAVRDRLAAGKAVDGLALASALWCRYCHGTTEDGTAIEANDPNWERLAATARAAKRDPAAWLGMTDIYGDTGDSPVFKEAFAAALGSLWHNGTATTLRAHITRR